MKTAIEQGVKGGIDQSITSEMLQLVAKAIREHGGTVDPSVFERLDALERQVGDHSIRLERHRLRIRWLERWAHIHWPGWFPRPGL